LTFSFSWSTSDDFINSENKFSCFGSRKESLLLDSEAFSHPQSFHVIYLSLEHVKTSSEVSIIDFTPEILNYFSTVISSIVGDDSGELLQGLSVRVDG